MAEEGRNAGLHLAGVPAIRQYTVITIGDNVDVCQRPFRSRVARERFPASIYCALPTSAAIFARQCALS